DPLFLALTFARTERAPTETELFAEGPHLATSSFERGDPTLGKETAQSVEASLRWHGERLHLDLSLYHMRFNDFIALTPTGRVFVGSSDPAIAGEYDPAAAPSGPDVDFVLPIFAFGARDAHFTGGEIEARYKLLDAGAYSLTADAALSVVRAAFK